MPALTTIYGFADTPTPGNASLAWTHLTNQAVSGALTITVDDPSVFPSLVEFDIIIGVRESDGTLSNVTKRHVTGVSGPVFTISVALGETHAAGESIYHELTTLGLKNNPGAMTTSGDMQYLNSSGRMARLSAPSNGQYAVQWTTGVPTWASIAPTTPAGLTTQVQFNDAGAFGAEASFTYTKTSLGNPYGALSVPALNLYGPDTPLGLVMYSASIADGPTIQIGAVDFSGSAIIPPILGLYSGAGQPIFLSNDVWFTGGSLLGPERTPHDAIMFFGANYGNAGTAPPYLYSHVAYVQDGDTVATFATMPTVLADVKLSANSYLGDVALSALSTPSAPTVTNVGTAGVTTYSYKIVANAASGHTPASATATTTTGNATLNGTNKNLITFPTFDLGGLSDPADPVIGVISYDVYRTAGGATQGKIATAVRALTLVDTGLAGDGSTAPATNTTGTLSAAILTISGTGTLAGSVIATAASATAFTNKTGLISQWANDASYTTLALVNAQTLAVFAATTSAQLAGVLSDETGFSAGALAVFSKSPTIETPTIASFVNATHTHLNAAGGGTLTAAAVTDLGSAAVAFTNKTGNISQWTNDSGYLTSVTGHAVLSATHTDTLAAGVTRGDLIYGNATPKWARLAIGTVGKVLQSDGTDISWAAPTGTGVPVLATSPTLVTPAIGVATGTSLALTSTITTTQSIAATSTDGAVLTNTTAAAAGAQQWSPRIRLTSQGWKTTATAASQTTDWIVENVPVQGSANPTSNLMISSQVNAAGYLRNLQLGFVAGTYATLWMGDLTPSGTNFILQHSSGGRLYVGADSDAIEFRTGNTGRALLNASSTMALQSTGSYSWSADSSIDTTPDLSLFRDAADTFAQRRGTNAQTSRLYNTRTDASNGEWWTTNWASNVLHIGTTNNGTGTARVMTLDYGGTTTSALSIPITSGVITAGGEFQAPSLSVSGATAPTGAGIYLAAGTSFAFSSGATPRLAWMGSGGFIMCKGGSYAWGAGTTLNTTADTILNRGGATATIQMGADVNGAAVAQTFKAHDGITGTDIAGANLTLAGGRGTGAGAPGQLLFQTSTALGSGTTAQTLATRLTIDVNGLTLADAMNFVLNATTGTKIGTATSQKLGFFNATPVVQRSDMSAMTDSTTGTPGTTLNDVGVVFSQAAINNNFSSCLTQINKVRTTLRDLGLMA